MLRKLFKRDIYKKAKLQPRVSDCDFQDGSLDDVERDIVEVVDGDVAAEVVSDESLVAYFDTIVEPLPCITKYNATHNPLIVPVLAQIPIAMCMNTAMMGMLQTVSNQGGALSNRAAASAILQKHVVEQLLEKIPESWDAAIAAVEKLASLDKVHLIAQWPEYIEFPATGLTLASLRCIRNQYCAHLLASLGMQQFQCRDGPVSEPKQYLPHLGLQIMRRFVELFDQASPCFDKSRGAATFSGLQDAFGGSFNELWGGVLSEVLNISDHL